jgi:hypothetical protein
MVGTPPFLANEGDVRKSNNKKRQVTISIQMELIELMHEMRKKKNQDEAFLDLCKVPRFPDYYLEVILCGPLLQTSSYLEYRMNIIKTEKVACSEHSELKVYGLRNFLHGMASKHEDDIDASTNRRRRKRGEAYLEVTHRVKLDTVSVHFFRSTVFK